MGETEFQGKKALIVDDAAIIRLMLTNFFEKHGMEVVGEAKTGDEALEIYKTCNADVITMDITMPGLDGISTIKGIMRINPRARVIVVSALGHQSKIQQALSAGAQDYVVKPIKEDRLVAAVRRVLREP